MSTHQLLSQSASKHKAASAIVEPSQPSSSSKHNSYIICDRWLLRQLGYVCSLVGLSVSQQVYRFEKINFHEILEVICLGKHNRLDFEVEDFFSFCFSIVE